MKRVTVKASQPSATLAPSAYQCGHCGIEIPRALAHSTGGYCDSCEWVKQPEALDITLSSRHVLPKRIASIVVSGTRRYRRIDIDAYRDSRLAPQ